MTAAITQIRAFLVVERALFMLDAPAFFDVLDYMTALPDENLAMLLAEIERYDDPTVAAGLLAVLARYVPPAGMTPRRTADTR